MNSKHSMVRVILSLGVLVFGFSTPANSATVEQKVDSLFVIASSGELKYRDSIEPAKTALAELGAAAVPRLVAKLTTPDARERLTVIRIIEKIGVAAVPHLRGSLTNLKNPLQLKRICWALGDLKDRGISAFPELISATTHQDWQVREYALRALGKVADSASADLRNEIINAIAKALGDSVGQARKSAVWASGKLRISELIPELVFALDDPYYGARMNANEALVAFGEASLAGLLVFLPQSPDSSPAGDLACKTLGELKVSTVDPLAEQRQMELAGQLSSRSALRRAAAALALGDCADISMRAELANLRLTERNPYVIESIVQALAQIAERQQADLTDPQ